MDKHKKILLLVAWALAVPAFMWSQVSFWQDLTVKVRADDTTTTSTVDQGAVDDTKSSISSLQKKIDQAQAVRDKLAQNLGQIQQSVSVVKTVIGATQAVIQDNAADIARKEAQVYNLNDQITLQKQLLQNFIQQVYYNQSQPILNVVLTSSNFADAFSGTDNFMTIGDKVKQVSDDLTQNITQVEQDKAVLADMKAQHEQVLAAKVDQQQGLVAVQDDVQGQIQKQDTTISDLQTKLDKLQSDLSSLLGVAVSTDNVKKAAEEAGNATGVRSSFILGELMQESGMGRYTGGCTYDNTRVQPVQAVAFKQIMASLNYNINSKKISCAGSVGYGGAMGIAQFMPTTWLGYKSYIAGATGDNPPDPWSVIDGVMGMAKKLANDGATSKKGEYDASMLYYCGTTHPASSAVNAACNNYAADVQSLTNGYENND